MEKTKDTRNRQEPQGVIDLRQELIDLYAGEQMLAFFEFTLERPGNEALSGLCRIAQPKPDRSTLRYLSLIFLVDAHDSATRLVVQKTLARLEGSALKTAVPGMTDGAIISSLNSSTESYIAQTDLLLEGEVNKAFITTQLIPAIVRIAQLHLTHVEWWEESPTTTLPLAPPSSQSSLLTTVRGWLRRSLSPNPITGDPAAAQPRPGKDRRRGVGSRLSLSTKE